MSGGRASVVDRRASLREEAHAREDHGEEEHSEGSAAPESSSPGRATRRGVPGPGGSPVRNHLLFPPRGQPRPVLRQVLSSPELRSQFLGADPDAAGKTHNELVAAGREATQAHRGGLADLLQGLDEQCALRRARHHREAETQRARILMREQYKQCLDSAILSSNKPPWTYTDPMEYFERPQLDTESTSSSPNIFLNGMYTSSKLTAPHNDIGGWVCSTRNERNEYLAEFKTKPRHRMHPTEKKFAEKLDRRLDEIQKAVTADAINHTTGSWKKQQVLSNAGEHSCLKRSKRPWRDQEAATNATFGMYPPYKPGERDDDDTLRPFIEQADRANSHRRNFVCGDPERTTHWRPPRSGHLTGSERRLEQSRSLLCPRGCQALLKTS